MYQVFSAPLYYNRSSGAFVDLTDDDWSADDEHSDSSQPAAFSGAGERREQMMLWAKKQRLPMFLRHIDASL